jgi:hypothetical protein
VPEIYVALEQFQTDYNTYGFAGISGVTLYENINLSSTIADAYASDLNYNVHVINGGTVGNFLYGC